MSFKRQPAFQCVIKEIRKRGLEMLDYVQKNFSIPENEQLIAREFLNKKFTVVQLQVLLKYLKLVAHDKTVKNVISNYRNRITNSEAEAFFHEIAKVAKKESTNSLVHHYVQLAKDGKILKPNTLGALLVYISSPCFELLCANKDPFKSNKKGKKTSDETLHKNKR